MTRPSSCPANLLFNARTQICDAAPNVDCTECSPFGIQHIEDPLGCSTYYRCVNGQKSRVQCAAGLMFNRQFGECAVVTPNQFCHSSICAPYAGHIKLGDPKNCNMYAGLYFSIVQQHVNIFF